jgi:hypothetical protein
MTAMSRHAQRAPNGRDDPERRSPTGVRLPPEYLRALEAVERHPDNQDGTDKSWVWRALKRNRDHFARAVRR